MRDEIGDVVQGAAEKEGRVFAIMCVALPFICPRTSTFFLGTMFQAWSQTMS